MSNLIKLKQIQGGTDLQNNVTDLVTKVGNKSVAEQISDAAPVVYEVTTDSTDITVIAKDITGKAGDVLIATNSAGVKSAYHYDANATATNGWVACDGKVDAASVILNVDYQLAGNYETVGNIDRTEEDTFEATGKSVQDVFLSIFTKKLQPEITSEPAVTISNFPSGAYEVGKTVSNVKYDASLSAGEYTYGPATGITAKTWSVKDTAGTTKDTASGTFDSILVTDTTNYSITATATYDAGTVAEDNLGGASDPTVQIAAGSKSKTSGAITGYRSFFYGVLATSTVDAPLTSDIIRGLTNGGNYNGTKSFTINANATAKRIVIAIPSSSTRGGLKEVKLSSAMDTPITDSYTLTKNAVKVADSRGGDNNTVDYNVYVYEPASIDAGEVHAVKLA